MKSYIGTYCLLLGACLALTGCGVATGVGATVGVGLLENTKNSRKDLIPSPWSSKIDFFANLVRISLFRAPM